MYESFLPMAAVALLAVVVLRWCGQELSDHGRLSQAAASFAALCVWLHSWVVLFVAIDGVGRVGSPSAWAVVIGVAAGLLGGAVAAAGVHQLGLERTLAMRMTGPETAGVFRWLAHPIYSGWVVMLLGVSVAGQSAVAAVLTVLLAAVFFRVARRERRLLEAATR